MHSEVELDLEDFSRKCTDIQFRSQPHKDKILKILQILREKFDPELSDTDLDLVLNSLRCLRNVVAGVEQNQTFLGQNIFGKGSENTLQNLLKSSGKQSDKRLLVPRLALQVTANCIVDHKENQHLLVNCDSLVSSLKYTLETCEDEKSQYFVTLILLTILKNGEGDRDEEINRKLSVFVPVLADRYQPNMEDLTEKCLEHFLSTDQYLKHLTSEERTSLVDILPCPPHDEVLRLLITDFNYLTDVHLLTTGTCVPLSSALEAHHLLALTQLLVKSSQAEEARRTVMQTNKSLVINTLYLLKLVHQAAASDTDLAVLSKLEDVERMEDLASSATFGFKASLIELLTSLVWGNPDHQGLVGELEGLPLLLDCSQVDARNPLITQRAVLAIRALTLDHPDNQNILAGTKKLGNADSSLLSELGLGRDSEGNIRFRPNPK